jgi:hypothetical protein
MTAAAFPQVAQLAQCLRTRTWRDMAKHAWLILLGMLLLEWLLPADLGNGMRPLILVAPLLPFIAKDLSHWPDALPRLRAAITADALELRVGARTGGTIPLEAIADCRRIDVEADSWCRREGIERHRTLSVSPLDKPNTALMLKPDSGVRLTHYGAERTGLACVFLYVDQPDRLIRAVRSEWQQ